MRQVYLSEADRRSGGVVCIAVKGSADGEEMKMVVNRFLASGMTMEEVSARMGVSIADLARLLHDKTG